MNIIIGTMPEEKIFPAEIIDTVQLAAETVGALYNLPDDAEASISVTDNAHIQELNKIYRGIDKPTDVLSFALDEGDEPTIFAEGAPHTLGDIIISVERAKEQAQDYGHSLRREIAFLTVHGMLHLLGYDHMEEADRLEMEAEQRAVMKRLGIKR
ncbi:MAG: rRNA maturation RNase YbeY [Selenomonadaceae bacterium]|nr:rRNA maturation RNase YbeY [Selenomonadaceae bacterium]